MEVRVHDPKTNLSRDSKAKLQVIPSCSLKCLNKGVEQKSAPALIAWSF